MNHDVTTSCKKCGAEISEGDCYCASCGQAIATRLKKTPRPYRSFILTLAAISLVGFALGAGIALWGYRSPSTPAESITPASPVAASSKPSTKVSTSPGPAVDLEDYIGTWSSMEETDGQGMNNLVLKKNGEHIQGVMRDQIINLAAGKNGSLEGTVRIPGQGTIPLTAGLSSDKRKITLVTAPPQGERTEYVFWKQDNAEGNSNQVDSIHAAPEIKGVVLGSEVDEEQRVVNPKDVFQTDTPRIFISVEVVGVTEETSVDIKLECPDSETLNVPARRISADDCVGFSLAKPNQSWPTGKYQAIVSLNGKEAETVSFSVQ